ncbi:MAG TPA: bifunctional methylenetetrahydrofolate dehydrogenase/methenyltetrahydrofolate cyclohydrolase [Polyangiales bacterium]|nr:bifunctional methylenetetrahydrofolate dehydrogenase/methenyltetrahydrofolate cyclohydrolase [Polyangiales bacterium]
MTVTIDPAAVAQRFREEIRAQLQTAREPLHLVGILAGDHSPSLTYALYAQRACSELGIGFELRRYPRLGAEAAIRSANADADVHGIIVYYPIFGTEQDVYLRELVAPGKDIEGLHSTWARHLYENRRFVDAAKTCKAILPCTPLAIVKLVEAAGFFQASGRPLEGRTVTVFNRSEVVGRPLASMLSHDGAHVYSFDVDGPLLFEPPPQSDPDAAHSLAETSITRQEALAQSDIVITGVPSKSFELVRGAELRQGALCINFSTYKNFSDDVLTDGKAACFIPRVGPMTVLMVIRNALRLQQNAQSS